MFVSWSRLKKMPDSMPLPDCALSPSERWAAHEREQTLFIARNTTPQQRVDWLDEMLRVMGPYLKRKDCPLEETLD